MKKRWKKKGQPSPVSQTAADPITRAIAVFGDMAAVCAGRSWRVVNIRSGAVLHESTVHEAPVRGLAFSPDGQYLLTCSDDKTACVWSTSDWACMHRLKSGKKATACTFSADSRHAFFSDRFGDVLCATTLPAAAAAAAPGTSEPAPPAAAASAGAEAASDAAAGASGLPPAVEATQLLGHLSSIVSSLAGCSSSTGQPLLVSTDKDGKVRASVLPADPVKGSFEILSYCLGHTKFVTSAAAVPPAASRPEQQQHLLVSGSGDGTIRLWDVDTGKQLSCFVASEQPPSLAFQQQQEAAGVVSNEQQQQRDQEGDADGDEAAAAAAGEGQEQEEQQEEPAEDEQEGAAAAAAAAGAQDGGACDGQQQDAEPGSAGADKGPGSVQGKYHKLREACCAVLSVAVSSDGSTVAAAVEGQQELQLLSLDAATQQLQLQQKLGLPDVANPAAVAFDGQGRLWVVGGVLARDTQSAHVGVAAKDIGSGEWQPVTADAVPSGLREALEHRVQDEEERQQQQQDEDEQQGYYFAGLKKAVYVMEGEQRPKKARREQRDIDRLRALTASKGQQQQQEQH